jgi:hypothetical protein
MPQTACEQLGIRPRGRRLVFVGDHKIDFSQKSDVDRQGGR